MSSLAAAIPNPDVLLALEPEELGAKLIFVLRNQANHGSFHLGNLLNELWPNSYLPNRQPPWPVQQKGEIDLAISEAWSWLIAQGLLVDSPGGTGHGFYVLSRRAQKFQDEAEFRQYAVARMLQRDALNPRIARDVWLDFIRGKFDVAVFEAFKAVEVAVREAAGGPASSVGVKLMRAAFNPDSGPLRDAEAETSERESLRDLFVGSIGFFKNPQSHRDVNLDDPAEALEAIMFANHLLRIVDSREQANQNKH